MENCTSYSVQEYCIMSVLCQEELQKEVPWALELVFTLNEKKIKNSG